MMTDGGRDEDELDNLSSSTGLLKDPRKDSELPEIPFCGCLSVKFYQPFFDVDTSEVISRMSQALFYCRREQNFLASISDKPDAYGHFWISTTLVFTVALVSHIRSFLKSWLLGDIWAYDFQKILTACSLIYGYAFCVPIALWLLCRHYEANIKFISLICLYGYAQCIFFPAVLFCFYPSALVSWIALLSASIASSIFITRNVGPILVNQAKNEAVIISIAICIAQVALAVSLKFGYFY